MPLSTDQLKLLEAENETLRQRIAELERLLAFHERHPTLARGLQGETLIATLLDGTLTPYSESHDVDLKNGLKIEVKGSGLNIPVIGASTQRWAWSNPFGENSNKVYDFLLLVGDADERFLAHYKDPAAPKVLFLVPYAKVFPLTNKVGRNRAIFLSSNPLTVRSVSAALFNQYQVTMPELEARFRFKA